MSQQDLFERILARLHEAALDDVHWSEAARLINEAIQAKSNFLAFSDRRRQPRPELFFCRLIIGREHRDDLERAHLRDFLLHDESVPRVKRLPRGELAYTADLYTDHEKRTSRTYNLIRGNCRQKNGLSVYLDGPVGSHIAWALGDSIAPGGWGSEQLERRRQARPELFFCRLIIGREHRDDLERAHLRDFLLHDESVPRVKRLPRGELAYTADLYTDHEKRTSRTYNLIRGNCRQKNGLSVYLDGPVGSHIAWALGDSIAPGGWGSEQLEMVSSLLPHVRQFVRILRAVADAEALGSSLADLLDNHRFGVIQLDRQGRVLEANDPASVLLRQGDGLVDRDGFLMARRAEDNTELQRLLARALTPLAIRSAAGSMTVRRSSRQAALVVHVNPVAQSQWYLRAHRVATLVLVVDPDRAARVDPGLVADALGLTPAEARLAVMLATGHSVPAIAALTRRTEGTVRWHMKQIFRKQRISRQADLVRRVLSLDGFPGSER